MALAEKLLAHEFNRDGHAVVDHRTYVFLGDGCLMEGISHEACALAGAWKLNRLIALYDDNGISIDGAVDPWFIDDTPKRFEAYGWNVIGPIDGHDVDAVDAALAEAQGSGEKPTLIVCKTAIGKGSPNRANTAKAHGEPLGHDEIALTRTALGWLHEPFHLPDAAYAAWDARAAGREARGRLDATLRRLRAAHPELARSSSAACAASCRQNFAADRRRGGRRRARQGRDGGHPQGQPDRARGLHRGAARAARRLADLTGSNLTNTKSTPRCASTTRRRSRDGGPPHQLRRARVRHGRDHERRRAARRLHPYGGTFLTFSDYSRNAIRMAALMKRACPRLHARLHRPGRGRPDAPVVEHAASLRLIPEPRRLAPGRHRRDAVAWTMRAAEQAPPERAAAVAPEPALPAQAEPTSSRAAPTCWPSRRGRPAQKAQAVILATGSEVQLALHAQQQLRSRRIAVRVVSMPSTTSSTARTRLQDAVLPPGLPRVAVEAGVTDGWWKYGCAAVVGIDTYGESAPAGVLFKHFGFTAENVAATVRKVLHK
jgi:transketolase